MKEKILDIIYETLDEINEVLGERQKIEKTKGAKLYGKNGPLDSLGLVNLMASLEQNFEDYFDVSIIIASEKAMSQKNSPFRTIDSLSNYIKELIEEELNE